MDIFDNRVCQLGEGPLWHPEREQLFWFDILGKRLLSQKDGRELEWQFDRYVSAAGWVDYDTLMIASDKALMTLDLRSGQTAHLLDLEADNPVTRSNDGRADPFGGFWIGTMGLQAQTGVGSIYRFHRGKLERLFRDISITNAICFAPDGKVAYFADTAKQQIMAQALDAEGWPSGDARLLLDLSDTKREPDGAVTDAEGNLWVASWGTGEVLRVSPQGEVIDALQVPASQPSCPAFGGPDFDTLFITTATQGLDGPKPEEGRTYFANPSVQGRAEYRVILD